MGRGGDAPILGEEIAAESGGGLGHLGYFAKIEYRRIGEDGRLHDVGGLEIYG